MLLIALLAGIAAVVLASRWMQAHGGQRADRRRQRRHRARRAHVARACCAWWNGPRGSVPPGAFTDLAALEGRVVKTGVQRGEPLIESQARARWAPRAACPPSCAEGKRAMTVRVNDVVGVAGFALPGNYVDIMVNTQKKAASAATRTRRSARSSSSASWCSRWRRRRTATRPSPRS